MSHPIEDYGLIGNTISAALVSRDGSIDWLCVPRFDSAACFAALLGDRDAGFWQIAPEERYTTRRQYRVDTAILETVFETASGQVTLLDFMPFTACPGKVDVVRVVRGDAGAVRMRSTLALRFNYGQAVPWVRRRDYGLSAVAGPDAVELHTRIPMHGENMTSVGSFEVCAGEWVPSTLSYHTSHEAPQFVGDSAEALEHTCGVWRRWMQRCRFESNNAAWSDAVRRSLITLKLLSYAPTGGIIAAPTSSLPEAIGGHRNWDYRYCWIRDSALTLYALLNAGFREEASAWRAWLLRTVAGHPRQLQIVYGIAGERWLPEVEIPWLAGYEGSKPVRIGNGAVHQIQFDIYGELMDLLHAAREADLAGEDDDAWNMQKVLLDHLAQTWRGSDHGIWEMRGPAKRFTHSRLMSWVAFDRAIDSAKRFGLEGPIGAWTAVRDEIRDDILENGFDHTRNTFVQHYGGTALDAALLLIPQVDFLPIDDPRVQGTIAAIERELLRDGLVMRYSTERSDDGVGGPEGAFLACSFWLVDAYVMGGRLSEAKALFDQVLSYANDLGLLAEEYEPRLGRLVGNFPQGFSHIGLVNSAFNLMRPDLGPTQQRAEHAKKVPKV
ncbi:MAG: glycoside hydrolase family 15 protein [Hyphomicrobiaceae bacterium]|nr:glycoside hydrolase family 15 protein [Hyphomicrobiaceae bacterium]